MSQIKYKRLCLGPQNSVVILALTGSMIIIMNALKTELNLHFCLDNFLEDQALMDIAKYTRQRMTENRKRAESKISFTGEETKLYIQRGNYNWKLAVIHPCGTAQEKIDNDGNVDLRSVIART